MPDLKPVFLPLTTSENTRWELDLAKTLQSLTDDLKNLLAALDDAITTIAATATTLTLAGTEYPTYGFFHDRGDASGYDFIASALTMDGNWHDMDLSSIVAENAKAISLWVLVSDATAGKYIQFRKNGNAETLNKSRIYNISSASPNTQDIIVSCDSGVVIEYYASSPISTVNIVIKGWWM
jgi:hypothetical protein